MGKKKPASILSKSSAKAAKKAKAAQKVERKEKKKVSKSKDDADENEDLEGILDKVSFHVPWLIPTRSDWLEMGLSRCRRSGRLRIPSPRNSWKDPQADEPARL
jgi:hypothetical protein